MITEGTEFGDFRIGRLIGWGGGGVVYQATQLSIGRAVAIKVLRAELSADPEFVERFSREGRVQASLHHAHILDVYEAGESPHGLYLALRLVEGGSLAERIAAGEIDVKEALALLNGVASALDAAHAAGVVHGDVKPQNVLLDSSGDALLTDFGLTRELGMTRATQSVAVMGTVAYIAPEIIHGGRATPASDRYSLAAMVFECLTGRPPYPRPTAAATLFAHTSEPPPAASEARPGLPDALDSILRSGLAKEPGDRPSSASALIEGTRAAVMQAPTELGPIKPPTYGTEAPRWIAGSAAPSPRRNRLVTYCLGAACVALIATSALLALSDNSDDRPSEAGGAVAPPPKETVSLGSALDAPAITPTSCTGEKSSLSIRPCSIAQADLSGATLRSPVDGVVTSWSIAGAQGDLALQVMRTEGDDSYQVARTQYLSVPDPIPHTFDADLPISKGDFIALSLAPGASAGIAPTDQATTNRWFPHLTGYPSRSEPDKGPGTGVDGEITVRADIEAGAKPELPKLVDGSKAAKLESGRLIESNTMRLDNPKTVRLDLIALDGAVYLDLFNGGKRAARMEVPDASPFGEVVDADTYTYKGDNSGEFFFQYVNDASGRIIDRDFGVYPSTLELFL